MLTNNTVSKKITTLNSAQSSYALRFSERRLLLQIGDVVCINAALLLMIYIQWTLGDLEFRATLVTRWAAVLTLLWMAIATISDAYNLPRAADAFRSMTLTGTAAVATIGLYYLIPYVSPVIPSQRTFLFLLPIAAFTFVSIWRLLYARVAWQPVFLRRVLIVGAGKAAQELMGVLNQGKAERSEYAHLGYNIVGLIDDDSEKQNRSVAGISVNGTSTDLLRLATQMQVDDVVLAITNTEQINETLFRQLLQCRESGVHVSLMRDMFMEITGRIPTEHIGRNLDIVLPNDRPATHRFYIAFRRIADIVLATLGCLFLLIVIPFIWIANRFTSPGDLFFRQERVGEAGRTYDVIKFRSMVMDAEKATGAVWAQKNDPRITPVGNFLRKTRLDEIPQFWNVLKGEMSLVGPRPERPHFVEQLEEDLPLYRVRHAVKPGVTGWAQVMYRYGASVEDSQRKLEYDLYYIKHQGPYLDLLILLRTIQVVLGMKGQ